QIVDYFLLMHIVEPQLQALSQLLEEGPEHLRLGFGSIDQGSQLSTSVWASQDHAQAMLMDKFEVGKSWLEVFPKSPNAEIFLAHVRIVHEDHTAVAHLRQPAFKVVFDHVVGVIAVDVQEIDRAVFEIIAGVVKGTLQDR